MAEDAELVSYEDLAAIEDEFAEIDTEICEKPMTAHVRRGDHELTLNQCASNTI